eukprot:4074084-Pleurochrysis_carterae.AAC.2
MQAAPSISCVSETPRRKRMRELATGRLEHQAGEMKKLGLRKDKAPGVLEVGTIVQVAVSDAYRSRVDAVIERHTRRR